MDYSTRQGLNYLPVWILVGIVPSIICGCAVSVCHVSATAPAAGGIFAHTSNLLVRGLLGLGLMLQLGLDVGGDGLLAGNPNHVV